MTDEEKKIEQAKKKAAFLALISKDTADAVAELIVDSFSPSSVENKTQLDFDFRIKDGKMVDMENVNTTFSMDIPQEHVAKRVIEVLGDETVDVDDEMRLAFQTFLGEVKAGVEARSAKLRQKVAEAVLGEKDSAVPRLEVRDVYLSNLPDIDWVLSLHKHDGKNFTMGQLLPEMIMIHNRTGEDFQDILKRKQAEGDIAYVLVSSVEKKKCIYEMDLSLFVDYSMNASSEKIG